LQCNRGKEVFPSAKVAKFVRVPEYKGTTNVAQVKELAIHPLFKEPSGKNI
jgi:hypothetical protein